MLVTSLPDYYRKRRDELMKGHPGAAFIFPSAQELTRNHDVTFPFRQESNFYYLTGFEEPNAWLVLAPNGSGQADYTTLLFVMKRNKEMEMWEGERYGTDRAKSIFGADEAFEVEEFETQVVDYLKHASEVYYRLGQDEAQDRSIFHVLETLKRQVRRTGKGILPIQDPTEALGEMRIYKAPEEIELMRKACQISAGAHRRAMEVTRPGMNECEIEAEIEYFFKKNGCARPGYGSIVAGGQNATCLHYRLNNEELKDGDLLLIDAGGEYGYYSADITRTFPVGKKFTPVQAKIYDIVLESQKAAIAICRPGVTPVDIHNKAAEVIAQGLIDLGILSGSASECVESGAVRKYFPHGTGHWLGMDVHDAGLNQVNDQPRVLEPGMTFTVEPGIYFQPDDTGYPEEYRGIGIRIEDNILITSAGHEVLTSDVPKEREDVEKLRG